MASINPGPGPDPQTLHDVRASSASRRTSFSDLPIAHSHNRSWTRLFSCIPQALAGLANAIASIFARSHAR